MIHVGNCLDIMPRLEANRFDSIVTDPPYGLGFMGKGWDHSVPGREFWEAALRVAKPGAYLAAFGGTRTFHRLACAIEDAGWELRDTLMWVYGSGFPKSHNGDWGGTALKPAWEPIILARKPLIGTVAANFAEHGTGGLNIDRCRVPGENPSIQRRAAAAASGWDNRGGEIMGDRTNPERYAAPHVGEDLGRWPANLIHDGSEEVLEAFPVAPGQSAAVSGNEPSSKTRNVLGLYGERATSVPRGDTGSAARFFYAAKASREDRNDGCEGMEARPLLWSSGTQSPGTFQAEGTRRASENNHPTVKPTELMRWLCRLVTPPGGLVLDPFAGSGSTGRGAIAEGMRFIGIELDPHYAAIATARIAAIHPGLPMEHTA